MRWVAAVVALAGLALACGGDDYRFLEVGECLPDGVSLEGVREPDPDRVPCSAPHRYEVYARPSLGGLGPEWPGEAAIDVAADAACQEQLDEAGIDRNDPPPGARILRIQPTEQSWNTGDDRAVECILRLGRPAEGRVTSPAGELG